MKPESKALQPNKMRILGCTLPWDFLKEPFGVGPMVSDAEDSTMAMVRFEPRSSKSWLMHMSWESCF